MQFLLLEVASPNRLRKQAGILVRFGSHLSRDVAEVSNMQLGGEFWKITANQSNIAPIHSDNNHTAGSLEVLNMRKNSGKIISVMHNLYRSRFFSESAARAIFTRVLARVPALSERKRLLRMLGNVLQNKFTPKG